MTETIYKATKYLRLSKEDNKNYKNSEQRTDSQSIDNQRKMIDDFLKTHPDIEVVSEKIDDGFSGILFDRPAFKEMMTDVEAGIINCIVVKDLSRFGREYIETGRYLRRILPAHGVRFIAINDNIDTLRDSGDDLVIGVKSILNDESCRDTSRKTSSALNSKREKGEYVGASPIYGYRKAKDNKNQLVIDEYPSSVIRDIYRMKLEGFSALKISKSLNNLGVLSPLEYKKARGLPHPKNGFAYTADAKWSAHTIIRILHDETYTGTLLQGRSGTFSYKIKDIIEKPESEWKRSENAHEAIISKQEFDLVKRIMQIDTYSATNIDAVYPLSGLLICGCCGNRLTHNCVPSKGKIYTYYRCTTTKKGGCSNAPTISENKINSTVLETLKAYIANVTSLEAILTGNSSRKAAEALAHRFETQIADNNDKLKKISNFKSSLYKNMMEGLITKEDFRDLKAQYTADEILLNNANDALYDELEEAREGRNERLKWMEHFKQFENLIELDRRVVVNLIQSIEVKSKTEIDITFSFRSEFDSALALLEKVVA